jgi:hypothetical protein
LPEMIRRDDIPLTAARNIWERIGSPGSMPPRTWWTPPDDRYLVANPNPSWPTLNEVRNLHIRTMMTQTRAPSPVSP